MARYLRLYVRLRLRDGEQASSVLRRIVPGRARLDLGPSSSRQPRRFPKPATLCPRLGAVLHSGSLVTPSSLATRPCQPGGLDDISLAIVFKLHEPGICGIAMHGCKLHLAAAHLQPQAAVPSWPCRPVLIGLTSFVKTIAWRVSHPVDTRSSDPASALSIVVNATPP
nr:unnamed protein product [Digitaria exilis]